LGYYRLRDIKTPPFAYVLNKDEVIQSCRLCQMPHHELDATLEIEICTTESEAWRTRIQGKPMMADHWLIGDHQFAEKLEQLLPGMFNRWPATILSWLTRSPLAMLSEPEDILKVRAHPDQPRYFYFKPVHQINLSPQLVESFPPIKCCECQREIPEIPFDFQPVPDPAGQTYLAAELNGLYLEGYDYLFHENIVSRIEQNFPEMILEKLIPEPMAI